MSNLESMYSYQVKKAIKEFGRDVIVIYGSTATCGSCSYDPINKTSTNITCSTCDGKYYYQTENTLRIKGAVKSFVGDMSAVDYRLHKFGYVPDHDARLTCWLEDILINDCSATGYTYLDKDKLIRLETNGKRYSVENTQRAGVHKLLVCVSTLKEMK